MPTNDANVFHLPHTAAGRAMLAEMRLTHPDGIDGEPLSKFDWDRSAARDTVSPRRRDDAASPMQDAQHGS